MELDIRVCSKTAIVVDEAALVADKLRIEFEVQRTPEALSDIEFDRKLPLYALAWTRALYATCVYESVSASAVRSKWSDSAPRIRAL